MGEEAAVSVRVQAAIEQLDLMFLGDSGERLGSGVGIRSAGAGRGLRGSDAGEPDDAAIAELQRVAIDNGRNDGATAGLETIETGRKGGAGG
jgi:hypothetical protein